MWYYQNELNTTYPPFKLGMMRRIKKENVASFIPLSPTAQKKEYETNSVDSNINGLHCHILTV